MKIEHVREWREQVARHLYHLDFEPGGDPAQFHASFACVMAEPNIGRISLGPGFTFRDQQLLKDGHDGVSLVVAKSRRVSASQIGRELLLDPGESTFLQASHVGRVGSRHGCDVDTITIPANEWEERGVRPHEVLMSRVDRRCEGLMLLRSYVRSLGNGRPFKADAVQLIRRHISDLVVLTATRCEPVGESMASAVVAARSDAALSEISSRLHDPQLSVGSVAQALKISPRYLQQLLANAGTTFAKYVNELRLARAFSLLIDGGSAKRVSDIALEVGYSDISYFNRLFRSRYGDTPTGIRGSGRRGEPLK
jgi:AraC-like DNA-binding protein